MLKAELTTKSKKLVTNGCICLVIFIIFVSVGISGCVLLSPQLSQSETLLEGVVDFDDVGTIPACYLTFNEPHYVNRIVIHTDYPVKGIDVYVSVGKDKWQRVKQFKNPIRGATGLKIRRKTDVIRVLNKSGFSAKYSVKSIEAFGY